jgi:hypothetical protein
MSSPLLNQTRAILITCMTLYMLLLRKCRAGSRAFSGGSQRGGVPALSAFRSR